MANIDLINNKVYVVEHFFNKLSGDKIYGDSVLGSNIKLYLGDIGENNSTTFLERKNGSNQSVSFVDFSFNGHANWQTSTSKFRILEINKNSESFSVEATSGNTYIDGDLKVNKKADINEDLKVTGKLTTDVIQDSSKRIFEYNFSALPNHFTGDYDDYYDIGEVLQIFKLNPYSNYANYYIEGTIKIQQTYNFETLYLRISVRTHELPNMIVYGHYERVTGPNDYEFAKPYFWINTTSGNEEIRLILKFSYSDINNIECSLKLFQRDAYEPLVILAQHIENTIPNNFVEQSIPMLTNLTSSEIEINGNKIWHEGNDGHGSGLDADLFDGQESSFYQNASNLNAGTINDARLPDIITSDITGNAATASKLATARIISLSGGVTGSVSFDGSADVNIITTVTNNSHTHDDRYYTKTEVDTKIANLVDSAPETLNTLNELANALGDDPNFATTVMNLIGSKLPISDYTAADVLAKIITVDGSGSGLDADLLDGQDSSYYLNASNLNAGTINDARLPDTITSNITGNSSTSSKLETARNISLTGDVTGSVSFDGSIDVTMTTTVADDSHNHIISNVDGLQTALDSKLNASSYTASDVLTKIKTVDGDGSGLDADLLDGFDSSSFIKSYYAGNTGVTELGRYIDFHTTGSTNDYDIRLDCTNQGNLTLIGDLTVTGLIIGTATAARYADLAEKYTCKTKPEIGTILTIPEDEEYQLKICEKNEVPFGVVSKNPGFILNNECDGVSVALIGQTPIRVIGKIKKGDPITIYNNGIGIKCDYNTPYHLIVGKALESSNIEEEKLVNAVIKI